MRGRGASSNQTGRFERLTTSADPIEDLIEPDPDADPEAKPRTTFFKDTTKSILNRNDSPDIGFGLSLNPYRGCEHGCIYCYARPTHEYLGLSAGTDFETKIFVKEDAPALLRAELMSRRYKPELVVMSGITDCYQPAEKRYELTRQCVAVLSEFKNPFAIISKNHLVTRDIDLIGPMARANRAKVYVTVTTLDQKLCALMEPRTSRPKMRLEGIRQMTEAGIPVGVMVAPVIPGLTDHELPHILEAAAKAGAVSAGYVTLRLPYGVGPLFLEWLTHHYPDRKDKVQSLIESMRGGKLNDSRFGTRMRGEGPYADMLSTLFKRYCREFGLNSLKGEQTPLDVTAFERPSALASHGQLSLFGAAPPSESSE